MPSRCWGGGGAWSSQPCPYPQTRDYRSQPAGPVGTMASKVGVVVPSWGGGPSRGQGRCSELLPLPHGPPIKRLLPQATQRFGVQLFHKVTSRTHWDLVPWGLELLCAVMAHLRTRLAMNQMEPVWKVLCSLPSTSWLSLSCGVEGSLLPTHNFPAEAVGT